MYLKIKIIFLIQAAFLYYCYLEVVGDPDRGAVVVQGPGDDSIPPEGAEHIPVVVEVDGRSLEGVELRKTEGEGLHMENKAGSSL